MIKRPPAPPIDEMMYFIVIRTATHVGEEYAKSYLPAKEVIRRYVKELGDEVITAELFNRSSKTLKIYSGPDKIAKFLNLKQGE